VSFSCNATETCCGDKSLTPHCIDATANTCCVQGDIAIACGFGQTCGKNAAGQPQCLSAALAVDEATCHVGTTDVTFSCNSTETCCGDKSLTPHCIDATANTCCVQGGIAIACGLGQTCGKNAAGQPQCLSAALAVDEAMCHVGTTDVSFSCNATETCCGDKSLTPHCIDATANTCCVQGDIAIACGFGQTCGKNAAGQPQCLSAALAVDEATCHVGTTDVTFSCNATETCCGDKTLTPHCIDVTATTCCVQGNIAIACGLGQTCGKNAAGQPQCLSAVISV